MSTRKLRKDKYAARILSALAGGSPISVAIRQAGLSSTSYYKYFKNDKEFQDQVDQAIEDGTDLLEEEAFRRAHDGVEKPVFQGGRMVGTVTEYSDGLLMFLLKGRRRRKFGDKQEVTGKDGKDLVPDGTFSEFARAMAELAAAREGGTRRADAVAEPGPAKPNNAKR